LVPITIRFAPRTPAAGPIMIPSLLSDGVSTVAKEPYIPYLTTEVPEGVPDDYRRADININEFGGLVWQAFEKAGAGAVNAARFFGQIAAHQASNNHRQQARPGACGLHEQAGTSSD
jgi:hypothetical protein